MTQEAADRIKEAEMKKPNPDYDLIRRTQDAAKRNEGKRSAGVRVALKLIV